MRSLLALSLLVVTAACGGITAPKGTLIHVRIVDEASRSAGPQALFVTLPSGEQVRTRTGMDGTARIRVGQGGEYNVKVIPSAGYLVPLVQSKSVSVSELSSASVSFVLRRHIPEWSPPTPGADPDRW